MRIMQKKPEDEMSKCAVIFERTLNINRKYNKVD